MYMKSFIINISFASIYVGIAFNAVPVSARIAPSLDGNCPKDLVLDKQSNRCFPSGVSLPPLDKSEIIMPPPERGSCDKVSGTKPVPIAGGYVCMKSQ